MLHFMHLTHPPHLDIYVQNSKHKSQNTEVTSFEHRTQNICIQNTMSHIGFRIIPSLVDALYEIQYSSDIGIANSKCRKANHK